MAVEGVTSKIPSEMLDARRLRVTPAQFSILFAFFAIALGTVTGLFVLNVGNPIKILGALLALGLVLGAFFKIEIGLMAIVFLTWTNSYDVAARLGLPPVAPLTIAFLLSTILYHAFFRAQTPSGWLRPSLLIFAFGLTGLMSFAYARDPERTSYAFFGFLLSATLATVVMMLLQNAKFFRNVIWTLIIAGCFMGGISVYQQFTNSWGNNFAWYGRTELRQITSTASIYRISGPIGDANFYAQIMIVLLPLSIGRLWHEKSKLLRFIALIAAAMIALTVILTFSRGAFLALLFTLGLCAFWLRPKWKHILAAAVLSLPLLALVPDVYFERIVTMKELLPGQNDGNLSDQAFKGRASEWKSALLMFADHPLLGVGLGNYPVHYQQYSRDIGLDPRLSQRSAHSLYLQMAAETGIVGLLILGFILWTAFRRLMSARKRLLEAGKEDAAQLTAAFAIGFLAYLFAGMFLHPAYPNFLWMLIGIAMATAIVAENEIAIETQRVRSYQPDDQSGASVPAASVT